MKQSQVMKLCKVSLTPQASLAIRGIPKIALGRYQLPKLCTSHEIKFFFKNQHGLSWLFSPLRLFFSLPEEVTHILEASTIVVTIMQTSYKIV